MLEKNHTSLINRGLLRAFSRRRRCLTSRLASCRLLECWVARLVLCSSWSSNRRHWSENRRRSASRRRFSCNVSWRRWRSSSSCCWALEDWRRSSASSCSLSLSWRYASADRRRSSASCCSLSCSWRWASVAAWMFCWHCWHVWAQIRWKREIQDIRHFSWSVDSKLWRAKR